MGEIPSDVRTMLSQKEYESDLLVKANNILHDSYRLTFGPEHVRYLIVDTERDIPELVDFIDGVRGASENKMGRCTNNEERR